MCMTKFLYTGFDLNVSSSDRPFKFSILSL